MAVKTNYAKGKSKYFRVSAVLGKDCNGKKIIKEFYGKSKSEAEEKKNKYLNGVADGLSIDVDNISIGELMRMWLFEISVVINLSQVHLKSMRVCTEITLRKVHYIRLI